LHVKDALRSWYWRQRSRTHDRWDQPQERAQTSTAGSLRPERIIESLLRVTLIILNELGFAPLDDTGTQLLLRLEAGAHEFRSLAIGSHWPLEQWGGFLPEQSTSVRILDRILHPATVVMTDGDFSRM